MDVRDINQLYIAENCDRTAGGAETIDGASVTGVQIHAPLIDAGTAAGTYYGNGELLITDPSGRVLTTTIIGSEGKLIPEIVFHQRSLNGRNHFGGKDLQGANITSYDLRPYVAPSEETAVVHTINATLQDYSYMLKIRRVGSDNNMIKEPSVRTAYFKSAAAGSTAAEIATGLVAYINQNFTNDPLVPVTAVVGGASSDAVIITAQALPFEVGKFNYEKLIFTVELVDAFSAIVDFQGELLFGWLPKWGIFLQPLGFLIFLIATMAESERVPFDLPEGESEIVGFFTEYGGMKWGMYMFTDFMKVLIISCLLTTLFFGGYQVPWLYAEGFRFPWGGEWLLPHGIVVLFQVLNLSFQAS